MNLIQKYIPTTQKSLFHKDICTHIRKWIMNLLDNDTLNKKKILFIYGPVGCGKSASINILLKQFNVINIDSNELKLEKTSDVINCIVGFNDITLSNIEKWNHSNKKEKPNIVLIDNIELCDKNIVNFVDNIHTTHNINVPIILICNNQKYKNLFISAKNCTYIEFNKPSLLELSKLIYDINSDENLNLSKENIKTIITKSEYDIRQVFYLLDQWKLNPFKFDEFIESINQKHADIDLTDKLIYLTDNTKVYDLNYTFTLSTSEPITLSNGIFQNYINIIEHYDMKEQNNITEENEIKNIENNCESLTTCFNILDNISCSNIFYSKIVEEQIWDVYDSYTINSCVLPSYYLKSYKKTNTTETDINEKELYYKMNAFKDISYNYMNSFKEVKNSTVENIFSKKININNKYETYNIINENTLFYYDFINLSILQIKIINENFELNKKGKNTSKSEKILLCKSITGDAEKALEFLTINIYTYKIFECNIDDILSNKNKYLIKTEQKSNIDEYVFNDDEIVKNIDKIDIRIFKRLLNIFSFYDGAKVLKSHVEMAIKYKIFNLLLNDIKLQKELIKKSRIESLTQNLDELWNFKKD
jgi:hypothetical protein